MDADVTRDYRNIELNGPISVERVHRVGRERSYKILIMGPTGAGKSSFIEALNLKGTSKISSGQLEGFTQSISTYRVSNVVSLNLNSVIYLVDSPGFADNKISKMGIALMVKKWLEENRGYYFSCVFYVAPVTNARLPKSQREVLETFRTFTGADTVNSITIVTTMWDTIWSESTRKRAESTFNQFRDDIWKGPIGQGAEIVKFQNTQDSALAILDNALGRRTKSLLNLESMVKQSKGLGQTPFGTDLYTDLEDRIHNLQLKHSGILLDLASSQADECLKSILGRQLEEVNNDLAKFEKELRTFGPPPKALLALPYPSPVPVTSSLPPKMPAQLPTNDIETSIASIKSPQVLSGRISALHDYVQSPNPSYPNMPSTPSTTSSIETEALHPQQPKQLVTGLTSPLDSHTHPTAVPQKKGVVIRILRAITKGSR